MSYDLVSGYSTVTGHHTPLYSNAKQEASADSGIQDLLNWAYRPKKSSSVPPFTREVGAA